MKSRTKEESQKAQTWGTRGLKIGPVAGVFVGFNNYLNQLLQIAWGRSYQQYKVKLLRDYGRHNHAVSNSILKANHGFYLPFDKVSKSIHFFVPCLATTAFVGGLGYGLGKHYAKFKTMINGSSFQPKLTYKKAESWADFGFLAGGIGGVMTSGSYVINHFKFKDGLKNFRLIKQAAKASITSSLICCGVGLFAGKVADKIIKQLSAPRVPYFKRS